MPGWLTARPIAHRGLHESANGVIENTTSAFDAAIAGNYAIETDLQLSGDGEAMVHHDGALGRLNEGTERLDAMTAADLKRVPFKATADRMLSLDELCDLVGGKVPLVIELKSRFDADDRLAVRTAKVLEGYKGPAALMSFDPSPIAALRDLAPALPRGLVAQQKDHGASSEHGKLSPPRFVLQAVAARLNFLAYRVQDLPSPIPFTARNILGLPLLTWTVRTPDDRERAARHADQIIFEGFRA
jgi:glycerophosphoryl diester phosphodiesterase